MGLQTAAQILAIRPRRRSLETEVVAAVKGHGKRAKLARALFAVRAERCCGALGGKLPTRLAGPRDHPE